MNTCYSGRSSCPARLFSFGLLDGPQVRLCRPHLREATPDFGLSRFATTFVNNPGLGVCPSHAVLLRQTICRHLSHSRPEKDSTYSIGKERVLASA
jgi:hypothetical protein